jgi:ABC-type lipoprotein release transport system permease subunit
MVAGRTRPALDRTLGADDRNDAIAPLSIAGATLATLTLGIGACLRPAARAAATDPAEALRE